MVGLVRSSTSGFDKTDLISDLKTAGFEDSIAEVIADRVEKRRGGEWTMDMGRQEAVRQAQDLLVDAHRALDTFRSSALTSVGRRDHGEQERSLSERLADIALL